MFDTAKFIAIVRLTLLLCAVHVWNPPACFSGDWPQILGPERNGESRTESLADDWVAEQPVEIWTTEIGEGYAGPAVVGKKLLVFHRTDGQDVLDCLATDSGKPVWSAKWKANYSGGIDRDRGPRCVPLVHEQRVFVLSAAGDMHSVNLADGHKLWTRSLGRESRAQDGYFGFGSSPIVVDDVLMVNVGGKNDQSILGIDPDSGRTIWTTFSDPASYSAPIERKGKRGADSTAIFVSRFHVLEVTPADGEIVFKVPFGAPGPTVNAASPLLLENDRLFVTSSYGIGCKCLTLKAGADVKWQSDDALSSQYPTPVVWQGHLFGVHGREDGAAASFRCVNATTGEVAWKENGFGMAHAIIADEKLLVLTTAGELKLVELSTGQYRELGSVSVSGATTRALPALSNGHLFLRDTGGQLAAWKIPTGSRE